MKQKFLYAAMISMLLIACTTEKEPLSGEPRRLGETGTRFPIQMYDSLYNAIQTNILPEIMEIQEISEYIYDVTYGYASIDSMYIVGIIEHYQDDILYLFQDALDTYEIPVDLSLGLTCSNAIDYTLLQMQDSVYVTPHFRNNIYEDIHLSCDEKVALCIIAAIRNKIYEDCYGYTIVVKDDIHSLFYKMQLQDTTQVSSQWSLPWDIYEIEVNDISLFCPNEAHSYVYNQMGQPIPFSKHSDRLSYFDDLNHDYRYVTSEECEIEYEESMEELNNRALECVTVSLRQIHNTACFLAQNIIICVWYAVEQIRIKKAYRECLESAEDEQEND